MSPWHSFRDWRRRRQLQADGRALAREARRVRRRFAHRLTPAQAAALDDARERLDAARRDGADLEGAMGAVDELLAGELAFAKKSTVRQFAESIGGAVFVALLLRSFVVQAYYVPSGSMLPTIQIGDRIWVNRLIYGVHVPFTDIKLGADLRPPRRGEIVVFRKPNEVDTDLIKRVVAVGGDTIELREGVVYINGHPTEHHHLDGLCRYYDRDEASGEWSEHGCAAFGDVLDGARFTTYQAERALPDVVEPRLHRFGPVRVPPGHLFVLGDNRDNSNDSRFWGFVPIALVEGRAMVVWWSYGEPEGLRFGRLGHLLQ